MSTTEPVSAGASANSAVSFRTMYAARFPAISVLRFEGCAGAKVLHLSFESITWRPIFFTAVRRLHDVRDAG